MLTDNFVAGTLADGCSCALVAAEELDALEASMTAAAGRELYPGELYGAAAQHLGVKRIYALRCPTGQRLDALLSWTAPGQVESLLDLPAETEEDLQIAGL
ncbi:hypothetical protein IV102_27470 [bacterium]|nr:hypothetical protein [bacterium]